MSNDRLPLRARPDDRGRVHLTPREADSASCLASILFIAIVILAGVSLVTKYMWPR